MEPAVLLEDWNIVQSAKYLNMPVPDFLERLKREPEWLVWANAFRGVEQRAREKQDALQQWRNRKR